jgi:hypothetical protein
VIGAIGALWFHTPGRGECSTTVGKDDRHRGYPSRAGDLREGGCSGRALQGDEIPDPPVRDPLGLGPELSLFPGILSPGPVLALVVSTPCFITLRSASREYTRSVSLTPGSVMVKQKTLFAMTNLLYPARVRVPAATSLEVVNPFLYCGYVDG